MSDMIERVALAIEATMFAEHELPLDAELHAKYCETARAAIVDELDAAADEIERLRNALAQIASKNDLSGISEHDLESAARHALYECEMIARDALTAPANSSGVSDMTKERMSK